MNTTLIKLTGLLTAVAMLPLLYCGQNPPNAGNSSQVGNPVASMLYNPDGSPAKQAKVCFFRHGDDPRNSHAVDSTYTDNNGNYTASLDTATYNILATLGTNATFQDSIIVTEGDTTRPPPDTLKSLGSISGRVELQDTDDPRTVFILFMGSNTFTRPTDLLGNFTATNMAKGKYAVTLITTLDDYAVMDTSFVITAGLDSVIPQPIVMNYTGIPIPKGLRIEYDTMKQIVTLYWNTPTTGRPAGSYNVYRRNIDSNTVLARINTTPVTDTTYSDSTGIQDMTYEYQVAVVDTLITEGTKSSPVQLHFSIADFRIDSIGIKGTGVGQLNRPQSAASNKSYYVIIDWQDPFPSAARANIFDLQGNYIRTFTVRQDTSSDNLIGIKCAIDSMNTIYAVARDTTYTFDITGNVLAKYPVAIREILYSIDVIIQMGSAPQTIAVNGNYVMKRNLINGDTISQFFIDGSYGSLSTTLSVDYTGNYFLGIYMSANNYPVLKCGPAGNVLATWDSTVSRYMRFNVIQEMATDSSNRVYIDDAGNSRIMVFSNTGEYLGQCETFLNTQKWQGTSYNTAMDRSLFINANNDLCLLEGEVFSKIFIFHIPIK
jgi:hypothetical protein